MSEALVTQDTIIEQPVVEQAAEPEQPVSIADHRAQFDPKRDKSKDPEPDAPLAPLAANATEAEKAAHHSELQRREKTGEFRQGKKRNNPAKRIGELTGRAKTAEERLAAAEAELVQLRSRPAAVAPQAQPAAAPAPPVMRSAPQVARVSDSSDPEPKETDEKYGKSANGPLEYFQDWSRWNVRDEHRQVMAGQRRQQQEEHANISFAQRAHVTAQRVGDFEQVVSGLDAARVIPAGSAIDQFILTDDNGPDVLYHLASNRQELDALLRIPVLQQIKHLALLSQRFVASPQAAVTGTTGSVPRSNVRHLVPRPPNPVRTEPHGATAGPPTDGSLSIADHKKQFAPQRRR